MNLTFHLFLGHPALLSLRIVTVLWQNQNSIEGLMWNDITPVLYSLAPGKFEWNFRYLIFQIISVIDSWGISCELALKWMSHDLTDDKSTLVQVMAWCHQATSHYLSQCRPRSLSPYGVTRPQWVNKGAMLLSYVPNLQYTKQWWKSYDNVVGGGSWRVM